MEIKECIKTRWTCPLCHCVVFDSSTCWCCGTVIKGGKSDGEN